ncbi:MFS transporter permease [Paramagnetospirillum marisnigri]|uniref:MFS transporter permease n=1 Tax=Paramagnetospirillum marisnigri TaxID=1285242 RepID=A0A178MSY1_9PROT|nr:3-phenylpropionate MFS transporter [Paramagnetospirillum marisnigri]OAN52752.1 MFS transporter permease [Paramagnetospirillum marisnigri]
MSRSAAALRLAAFYAAIFAAVGIHIPFWPLWLKDRGLSPTEIGLLVAAGYMTRLVATPLVGHWVDHRGDRKRPLLILSIAAALTWLAFPWVHGFWAILVVTVVTIFPFTSLMPVGDALSLMVVQSQRLDYGRIRLWGSLAFIIAATTMGQVLADWPVSLLPWLMVAALALTAATCTTLPDARVPAHEAPAPLAPLMASGIFLLFLATAAFNQSAHTVYYAFATIHWKASGLSDPAIGILWSEGVVAEILLFAFSGWVVARLGPSGLLLAAALGGVARWSILGLTADPVWVAAAQLLHAATFGCGHLGAMHFISRAVPPSLAGRAQGVYAAIAVGLAPGLMTPLSGYLFELLGGASFLAMGGLSAISSLLAWRLLRSWRNGHAIPM